MPNEMKPAGQKGQMQKYTVVVGTTLTFGNEGYSIVTPATISLKAGTGGTMNLKYQATPDGEWDYVTGFTSITENTAKSDRTIMINSPINAFMVEALVSNGTVEVAQ